MRRNHILNFGHTGSDFHKLRFHCEKAALLPFDQPARLTLAPTLTRNSRDRAREVESAGHHFPAETELCGLFPDAARSPDIDAGMASRLQGFEAACVAHR